jgi:hypothetical protein
MSGADKEDRTPERKLPLKPSLETNIATVSHFFIAVCRAVPFLPFVPSGKCHNGIDSLLSGGEDHGACPASGFWPAWYCGAPPQEFVGRRCATTQCALLVKVNECIFCHQFENAFRPPHISDNAAQHVDSQPENNLLVNQYNSVAWST